MSLYQKETKRSIPPIHDFLEAPRNRWLIAGTFLILSGIYLYYVLQPECVLFPNAGKTDVYAYDDQASGGNSQVRSLIHNDSLLQLEFELKEGSSNPYVGVTLVASDLRPMDVSAYNTFKIHVEGENVSTLVIAVYTPNTLDPEVFSGEEIWYQKTITLSDTLHEYAIHLDDFKVPDWWLETNRLAAEDVGARLNHVRNINIGSAFAGPSGGASAFSIRMITFTRDNTWLGIALLLVELALISLLLVIHWLRGLTSERSVSVTVEYKSVDAVSKSNESHGVFRYINEHFNEMEFTLEEVARQTGQSTRRISATIRDQFQCNFKTYLNRLRINESKRLLHETDLTIGEVAYKVGFNNQSHFNRVFRYQEKISPSQFRSGNTP